MCCQEFDHHVAAHQCNGTNRTLRFNSGDKVLVQRNTSTNEWLEGTIAKIWPKDIPNADYLVKGDKDNFNIAIYTDSVSFIRANDFDSNDGEQVLFHHVKYGTSVPFLKRILKQFGWEKKWAHYGPWLLLKAAVAGNLQLFMSLINEHQVSGSVVDESGDNILHLAIKAKMSYFTAGAVVVPKLNAVAALSAQNSEGKNPFHLGVKWGHQKVFEALMYAAVDVVNLRTRTLSEQCIFGARDSQGLTPLEIAVRLKRSFCVEKLCGFTVREMCVSFQIEGNQNNDRGLSEAHQLVIMKRLFTVSGLTTTNCVIQEKHEYFFNGLAAYLTAHYHTELLKWLFEESGWEVDKRVAASSKKTIEKFYWDAMVQCNGDYCSRFQWPSQLTMSQEVVLTSLVKESWADILMEGWDGKTSLVAFAKTFTNIRHDSKTNVVSFANGVQVRNKYLDALPIPVRSAAFESFVNSMTSQLIGHKLAPRQKMISFLSRHCVNASHMFNFLSCPQPHMFLWALDTTRPDLFEMKSVSELVDDLEQNSEKMLLNDKKLNRSHRPVAMGEFYCAYAARVGLVSVVKVMLRTVRDKNFTIQGRNTLQHATVIAQGEPTVKWGIMSGTFDKMDLCANGIDTLHEAIKTGRNRLALYLLSVLGNNSHCEQNETTTWTYAQQSTCKELNAWAREQLVLMAMNDVMFLASDPTISGATLRRLAHSVKFSALFFKLLSDQSWVMLTMLVERNRTSLLCELVEYYRQLRKVTLSVGGKDRDSEVLTLFRSLLSFASFFSVVRSSTTQCIHQSIAVILAMSPLRSTVALQRVVRGWLARKRFQLNFGPNREQWASFKEVWGEVTALLRHTVKVAPLRWDKIRAQFEVVVCADSLAELTNQAAVVSGSDGKVSGDADCNLLMCGAQAHRAEEVAFAAENDDERDPPLQNIELSSHVLKWLEATDKHYRAMFVSRMERLAAGDRSYALSKRLQHCGCPIHETKLDKGQQILWTKVVRDNVDSIMVSYSASK